MKYWDDPYGEFENEWGEAANKLCPELHGKPIISNIISHKDNSHTLRPKFVKD